MKYRIEIWTIEDIINKFNDDKLNLNPEYQRRFIWTLSDQQTLIKSILSGYAVPNLFLYEKEGGFEVVDGQQRIRTIIGYYQKGFKSNENQFYDEFKEPQFKKYIIPVTIIENISSDESIEEFYSLVNNSGVHLNRPELKKAEYFNTNFLKLINELSDHEGFKELNLFTDTTSKRMNDIDFVSELVTLIIYGITDKKITVDKLFESDINESEIIKYRAKFNSIIELFVKFNNHYIIKKTRYKQRNDFFSLFHFVNEHITLGEKYLTCVYNQLVLFNDYIAPSNEKCEPFQQYAFHCISQSNSKFAREERSKILKDIFYNKKPQPNKTQKQIIKFFNIESDYIMVNVDGNYLINSSLITESII